MAETPTYETDDDGYPTEFGILQMLRNLADTMPRGLDQSNMYYAIGYIRCSMGISDGQ